MLAVLQRTYAPVLGERVSEVASEPKTLADIAVQLDAEAQRAASAAAMAQQVMATIPEVIITQVDLDAEATNSACTICMEDQVVGGRAAKLQCGHLFCRGCIGEWLRRNCTCPVCPVC